MTLTRFTQRTAAKTLNDTDHWLFAVIAKDNGLALSIDVDTPFRNGVLPEGTHDELNFRVLVMGLHHPFATTQWQVLHPYPASDCKLIPTCNNVFGYTEHYEATFFASHFNKHWAAGASSPSQPKSFWDAMVCEFHERWAQLQQQREVDGDLKWQRCTHCDGQGVIDRTAKAVDLPVTATSNHEAFADDSHVTRHLAEGLPPGWTSRMTHYGIRYYHDTGAAVGYFGRKGWGWTPQVTQPIFAYHYCATRELAFAAAVPTPATPQPTQPSQPRSWADAAIDTIQTLTAERDRAVARVKFLEAKCDEAQAVLGRSQRSEP